MRNLIMLISILSLISCSSDDEANDINVDLNGFEAIHADYPYTELNGVQEISYLELIEGKTSSETRETISDTVLFSTGQSCLEEDCVTAFNDLKSVAGFANAFYPDLSFKYLKVHADHQNFAMKSPEDLMQLLGEIKSPGEALLLASVHNYFWSSNNVRTGGIKETAGGFELLLKKKVRYCKPVQTNRYHLKISREGKLTIISKEVEELLKDACFE